MTDIVRTIRLFGAFRRFGASIEVAAPDGATAAVLKTHLADALRNTGRDAEVDALVAVSVLATDREVLDDAAVPPPDAPLAALPPVSGG